MHNNVVNKVLLLRLSLLTGMVLSTPCLSAEQLERRKLIPLDYSRSGPTAEEIAKASGGEPSLAPAHALSLSIDIPASLTQTQRSVLKKYGPWLTDDGISSNAQQLIRAVQDSAIHGLNPEAYGTSKILATVDRLALLDRAKLPENSPNHALYQTDRTALRDDINHQLNTAFQALAEHLGRGVVNGRSIQTRLYRDAPDINHYALVHALNTGQLNAADALAKVTPQHPGYGRLTRHMRDLLTERASGVKRTSVNTRYKRSLAQNPDDVINIKMRLIETGELPASTTLTNDWDETIRAAIPVFQKRHGLPATGTIASRTRKALNLSIEDEITAVSLSLERWRWMPRALGTQHIEINIPDYRVTVIDGNRAVLSMAAVMGSIEHPTPVFTRDMTYIDFNPTWTVPASITNSELIPLERRKPGYLVSRGFDFLKPGGKQLSKVPYADIPPEDFQSDQFPYVLRQQGGVRNALGRMKFMMPNPYAIYLHDTPSKRHFALSERAFSHGCIRLSEPDNLARWLLLHDGLEEKDITAALNSKEKNRIRLRSPIPTHLSYMTTWIDDSGKLQRRNDIYGHDTALAFALQAKNTLLSTLLQASEERVNTRFTPVGG